MTYTGGRFWPLEPRPEDVNIEDIAHALSLMCRYNGHVKRFYSVAEHSLNIMYSVPDEWKLEALLHDASEAYLADLTRPAKQGMPEYREFEHKIEEAIAERFNLKPNYMSVIKEYDNRIIVNERAALFKNWTNDWACDQEKLEPIPGLPEMFFGMSRPEEVEERFIANFEVLIDKRQAA